MATINAKVLQPCAAGERCLLKKPADPTHKCPECRRHIHAVCGVALSNPENPMNSMICFDCLGKNPHPPPIWKDNINDTGGEEDAEGDVGEDVFF